MDLQNLAMRPDIIEVHTARPISSSHKHFATVLNKIDCYGVLACVDLIDGAHILGVP